MIQETASMYQIFVRNFTEKGTFQAALPRLEGIRKMGFDWVYLTPIHPIGQKDRKGSLGSPYAIQNFREINADMGTEKDFRLFVERAHGLGLRVMIDVVYNHTSPDAVLVKSHPEWYLRDNRGNFGRKFADWSDVIDFNFASSPALWDELIDTLLQWRDSGVDGFRCDVASLVPLEFWREARKRVNQPSIDGKEAYPVVWLAEQVHPHFLQNVRNYGFACHGGPELHQAFDLTYDYDGFEWLEMYWGGKRALDVFVDYLYVQQTVYPAGVTKVRFLENHDQKRAAWRFGRGNNLRQWTALYQLLHGVSFVYMGQEYALDHTPSLFEREPVQWQAGDGDFYQFFQRCFSLTQAIKSKTSRFSAKMLGNGIVWIERCGEESYGALLNLENKRGEFVLPFAVKGIDCLTERQVSLESKITLPTLPLILRLQKG